MSIYENDMETTVEIDNHVYEANTTTNSSAHSSEVEDEDTELESSVKGNICSKNEEYKALYQANSLAAAQMLQLMSSTGGPSSVDAVMNSSASVDQEKENIPI